MSVYGYVKIGNISGSQMSCQVNTPVEFWVHYDAYIGAPPDATTEYQVNTVFPRGSQTLATPTWVPDGALDDNLYYSFTPTVPGLFQITGYAYSPPSVLETSWRSTVFVRPSYPTDEQIFSYVSASQFEAIQLWQDMMIYVLSSDDFPVPPSNFVPRSVRTLPITIPTQSINYPTFTTHTGSLSGSFSGSVHGRLYSDVTGSFLPVPTIYPFYFQSGSFTGSFSGTFAGTLIGSGVLYGNFAGSGSASINGGAYGVWSGTHSSSSISGTMSASVRYFKSYESDGTRLVDISKISTDGVDRIKLTYLQQSAITNVISTGSLFSLPLNS